MYPKWYDFNSEKCTKRVVETFKYSIKMCISKGNKKLKESELVGGKNVVKNSETNNDKSNDKI